MATLTNEGFGLRLREAIEKTLGRRGQAELARRLGKPSGQINRYAHGRVPDWPILIQLAEELGVTIDWLLRGSEETQLRPRRSGLEIRGEFESFMEQLPDVVIERMLWQAKALLMFGQIGPEAFPDYVREVRGD
jgi:transcriptional regulator with XRE-family HTH domain